MLSKESIHQQKRTTSPNHINKMSLNWLSTREVQAVGPHNLIVCISDNVICIIWCLSWCQLSTYQDIENFALKYVSTYNECLCCYIEHTLNFSSLILLKISAFIHSNVLWRKCLWSIPYINIQFWKPFRFICTRNVVNK